MTNVLGGYDQHADAPHALDLLRAGRERIRGHRAAEKRYKLAPSELIECHLFN
jgi:hypothetical protein